MGGAVPVFLSAVVYALGGYVWLNFVGRSPAFRSLLVQWLFFARLEHSPISRVGRGSFGSLVLRYSARPWPLALLSEVGLALRCVLWFALVCDRCARVPPSRPSRAFRGHLALHGDPGSLEPSASLRRSASFSAIAPWDRLAAPRSTTTAPGSCFWISPNLLGGFCSLWPVLAWVVRGQFWPGLFVASFGLGCSGRLRSVVIAVLYLPPRETPLPLPIFSHTLSALEGRTCRISKAHHYLTFPRHQTPSRARPPKRIILFTEALSKASVNNIILFGGVSTYRSHSRPTTTQQHY